MRAALITLIFLLSTTIHAHAACTKAEVCEMMRTMDHFSILNKCPQAAKFLRECKKVSKVRAKDLPEPNFVDNGDGTVTDTKNNLVWLKKGIMDKVSLKEAKAIAATYQAGNVDSWRISTLAELKSLLNDERVENASGEKAWIHPLFDDGRGHYYWTSTTCDKVSVVEDRYQEKTCQKGETAAWLVHFNIKAIFWHHVTAENYHVWLVADAK